MLIQAAVSFWQGVPGRHGLGPTGLGEELAWAARDLWRRDREGDLSAEAVPVECEAKGVTRDQEADYMRRETKSHVRASWGKPFIALGHNRGRPVAGEGCDGFESWSREAVTVEASFSTEYRVTNRSRLPRRRSSDRGPAGARVGWLRSAIPPPVVLLYGLGGGLSSQS